MNKAAMKVSVKYGTRENIKPIRNLKLFSLLAEARERLALSISGREEYFLDERRAV